MRAANPTARPAKGGSVTTSIVYSSADMTNRLTRAGILPIALAAAIPLLAMQVERGATTLTLNAPAHHLFDDRFAREPMIVEHPSGALFVAGYGMMSFPT